MLFLREADIEQLLDMPTNENTQTVERTAEHERCYNACKPMCKKQTVIFRKTEALFPNHLQTQNMQVSDRIVSCLVIGEAVLKQIILYSFRIPSTGTERRIAARSTYATTTWHSTFTSTT